MDPARHRSTRAHRTQKTSPRDPPLLDSMEVSLIKRAGLRRLECETSGVVLAGPIAQASLCQRDPLLFAVKASYRCAPWRVSL